MTCPLKLVDLDVRMVGRGRGTRWHVGGRPGAGHQQAAGAGVALAQAQSVAQVTGAPGVTGPLTG